MDNLAIRPITTAEIFDAAHLIAEYAVESSIDGMPAPAPNREIYTTLESAGVLHARGAFLAEALVGFILLVVTTNPHYGVPLAVTESYFVASEYRKTGAGLALLHAAEGLAKELGAVGILVSAPSNGRLADVLPRTGYAETNRVFFRRLA
jgi:GNAT superfamily N-acetyltransferase